MIEYVIFVLGFVVLWADLGLVGLIIGVLKFGLSGSHRNCFWACIFGPVVLIAVIDAIIRGEDV